MKLDLPAAAPPEAPAAPPAPFVAAAEGAAHPLAALAVALREEPTAFEFFQAVRLLERLWPEHARVGRFADPAEEVVRFSVPPSISFPPSEIHALELPTAEGPGRMSVNFLGLTGPQGALPYHYTLLAAERKRARDGALGDFLDLFHHRLLSLFYRAWEKHRFDIGYERQEDDRLTEHLLDLIGLGEEAARDALPLPAHSLLFYAGLLVPQPRGAVALRQMLEEYFGVTVAIEQFVGAWYPLPRRDQCALGEEEDPASQLGRGAVAGDEVWDQQIRVRVRLGPLTRPQFDDFLPTGSAFPALRALTRFFSHEQYDFEIQLVLARDEVPGFVLGADEREAQPLGWSTWIRTAPFPRDADETLFRL